VRELAVLEKIQVILALGGFAWEGALRAIDLAGGDAGRPRPRFGHGVVVAAGGYKLMGSYHPSQQNTFTGKLTEAAFDDAFMKAKGLFSSTRSNPDVGNAGQRKIVNSRKRRTT